MQGSQILGALDTRTDDFGYTAEQMNVGGRELVTADKPTVVAESLLDAIIMEGSQSDRCISDPTRTNGGDGCQVFGQVNNLLDQHVTSETGPRRRWRWFTRYIGGMYEILGPLRETVAHPM